MNAICSHIIKKSLREVNKKIHLREVAESYYGVCMEAQLTVFGAVAQLSQTQISFHQHKSC